MNWSLLVHLNALLVLASSISGIEASTHGIRGGIPRVVSSENDERFLTRLVSSGTIRKADSDELTLPGHGKDFIVRRQLKGKKSKSKSNSSDEAKATVQGNYDNHGNDEEPEGNSEDGSYGKRRRRRHRSGSVRGDSRDQHEEKTPNKPKSQPVRNKTKNPSENDDYSEESSESDSSSKKGKSKKSKKKTHRSYHENDDPKHEESEEEYHDDGHEDDMKDDDSDHENNDGDYGDHDDGHDHDDGDDHDGGYDGRGPSVYILNAFQDIRSLAEPTVVDPKSPDATLPGTVLTFSNEPIQNIEKIDASALLGQVQGSCTRLDMTGRSFCNFLYEFYDIDDGDTVVVASFAAQGYVEPNRPINMSIKGGLGDLNGAIGEAILRPVTINSDTVPSTLEAVTTADPLLVADGFNMTVTIVVGLTESDLEW